MINLKSSMNIKIKRKINHLRYILLLEGSLTFIVVFLIALTSALNISSGVKNANYDGSWLSTSISVYIIWIGLLIFSIWNWYRLSWRARKIFSNDILYELPCISQMLKLRSYFFLLDTFYYFSKKQLILNEMKLLEKNMIDGNFNYSRNFKTIIIDGLNFLSVILMVLGTSFSFSSYPKEGVSTTWNLLSKLDIAGTIIGFLGVILFLIMLLYTYYAILCSKNKWWIKLVFMIPFVHLFSFYITFCPNYEFFKTKEISIS